MTLIVQGCQVCRIPSRKENTASKLHLLLYVQLRALSNLYAQSGVYRLILRGICSGIESGKDALETEVLNLVGCPRTDV
jgi:hypothetical protein